MNEVIPAKRCAYSGRVVTNVLAVVAFCLVAITVGSWPNMAEAHGAKLLTKQIPAQRLIRNLKAKLEEDPSDPTAQFQLARAYMISAYSEKTYVLYRDGTMQAHEFNGRLYQGGPWGVWDTVNNSDYGVDAFPPNAEARVRWKLICGKAPCDITLRYDKDALRKSALHQIEHAIAHYERALELKPDPLIKLGLGWALDVHGEQDRAKELYREIVAQTWPSERNQSWGIQGEGLPYNYGDAFHDADAAGFNGHLSRFLSYEAAFYLSALLDPSRDREELMDLRAKMIRLAKNGTGNAGITPIIIPMDRRSPLAAIVDATHYVDFNLDGLGVRKWQWITPKAGFLVFVGESDRPVIASGHQLLGNVTFRNFWRNGYDAASSLDDNADGWLRGEELSGLAVWNDRDQNGTSRADELVSLDDLHITGIAVAPRQRNGNVLFHLDGIEYSDGQTGPSYDWVSYTKPNVLN